jgi:thiol:disulfide interchange protein DsbD
LVSLISGVNSSENSTSSAATPGQTAPAGSGDISLSAEAASAAAHNSLWKFLLAAAGFALLSLLTPCVFPMIPITVSYFTKQSEQHQGSAIGNASVFSLGIIGTYTVGGFLIARLAGAGGINRFASSPWTNLLITIIFVVFALSLFGAFLIQLPSGFVNKMDSMTRREGGSRVGKNLLMGFTFTLTSFTCTVAFVGTLLVMMTTQNTWFVAVLGMLVFSCVFALPFFLLALVPALMKKLPRSGGWMNSVKVVMGFLEIAAAVKFISNADLVWHWNVFTRSTCLALWVAIGLLITAYILGLFKFENDSPVESIGATRTVLAMFFLAITVWLGNGLLGAPLGELDSFLPPDKARISGAVSVSAGQSASGDLAWIENDYPKALDEAKRQNKQVFVDFTGYTCTNCRWMELNMFPRAEVRRELQKYVRVRLYTDGSGPVFEQQKQMQLSRFGTAAQPYYVILNADGNPRTSKPTFPGMTRKVEDFVAFLRG